jgi:hypothetical protein
MSVVVCAFLAHVRAEEVFTGRASIFRPLWGDREGCKPDGAGASAGQSVRAEDPC